MQNSIFVLLALVYAASCARGGARMHRYDLRAVAASSEVSSSVRQRLLALTRRLTARYVLRAAGQGVGASVSTERSETPDRGYLTEEPEPNGLTLDPCFQHSECAGGRLCIRDDWKASCSGDLDCLCLGDTELCDTCTECSRYPDELCIDLSLGPKAGICGSAFAVYAGGAAEVGCTSFLRPSPVLTPSPLPTPSPMPSSSSSSTPVRPSAAATAAAAAAPDSTDAGDGEDAPDGCVDAQVLAHLPPSALVFPAPRLAPVLCDVSGSCATPGHMVVYHGTPMSMRAYCNSLPSSNPAVASVVDNHSACVATRMLVNSPRYARAWRLKSPRTPGLEFTALAARFETRLEELSLTLALRMGL